MNNEINFCPCMDSMNFIIGYDICPLQDCCASKVIMLCMYGWDVCITSALLPLHVSSFML